MCYAAVGATSASVGARPLAAAASRKNSISEPEERVLADKRMQRCGSGMHGQRSMQSALESCASAASER